MSRLQVIVLGMHRSGTSVVTRLINLMGCHLGDESDLLPAKPDNPKGFWERRDAYRLNREIFAAAHCSWFSVLGPIEPEHLPSREARRLQARVEEIVTGLTEHGPWVLKDPRLALVLPFWSPFLQRPVAVIPHRRPGQVAESLHLRDGIPPSVGVALWELYNLSALRVTRGIPRIVVGYEELLQRPVETARWLQTRLSELGGTAELREPPAGTVESFVSTDLFRARGEAIVEHDYLNERRGDLLAFLAGNRSREPASILSSDSRELLEFFSEARKALIEREERLVLADTEMKSEEEIGELGPLGASWRRLEQIEEQVAHERRVMERSRGVLDVQEARLAGLGDQIERIGIERGSRLADGWADADG
ncbi:MAG: hypothetical protein R3234_13010 [Thermoanaerobaculia bacterium]|nr:hypothetical protein [Thermoanaerobaculia bacterium]